MSHCVLDAWALMAFLADESAAERVDSALRDASDVGAELPMCVVNWGEVVYQLLWADRRRADRYIAAIEQLPVALVAADTLLTGRAASLRARFGLGYADCFAAALALALRRPLMTGDPDFLSLAEYGLELDWIGSARS